MRDRRSQQPGRGLPAWAWAVVAACGLACLAVVGGGLAFAFWANRPLTEEQQDMRAETAYREYQEAGYKLADDRAYVVRKQAEVGALRADPAKQAADRLLSKEVERLTFAEEEVERLTARRAELEGQYGGRWTRLGLRWPLPVQAREAADPGRR